TVRSSCGDLAAAGLFSEHAGLIQYLFGGTAQSFLKAAPTTLMFDSMIRWGQARGRHVLHLGGGVGARHDSLFFFKAGFSKLRADFFTARLVFHGARYATLVDRWHTRFGATPLGTDGFFPGYRAPALAARHDGEPGTRATR